MTGENRDNSDNFRIGIVILNWKHPEDTLRCLESLSHSSYTNFHIVIVDNGSGEQSLQELRDDMYTFGSREIFSDRLTLLESPQNLGYTGGNNLGINHFMTMSLSPHYLLLLNDDATINGRTLAELVQVAQKHPEAGFLGPKIMALEEPEVLLSAGGMLVNGYQPRNRGLGELDRGQFDHALEVDFLSGCALLVKRQVVEQIGLLDDDYFAYHEEIDWCHRGRQAGFTIRLAPTARVWHPDTRRRDHNSPLVTYYTSRNSLLFARKHRLGKRVINLMLLGYVRRLLSWHLRPRMNDKIVQRKTLTLALWDYLFGHYGKRDGLQ